MSRQSPRNVFHTPKTYQPSSFSGRPSPTPSRTEVLLEELGIETDELGVDQLDSSGSDAEDLQNGDTSEGSPSDLRVLQREFTHVKIERDELLLKVKTLREKTEHYQQLASREKASKSQQLKILRKTHEGQLSAKTELLQNLQDIIEEQEGKIFELEAQIQGTPTSAPQSQPSSLSSRVRNLSDALDQLQAQMAIMKQNQHTEGAITRNEENKENTTPAPAYEAQIQHLTKKLEEANRANQKLREEQLHKIKGLTDNEKEVEHLQGELEKMQRLMGDMERQYEGELNRMREDAKSMKKQEAESFALKERQKKMKKQLEDTAKQNQMREKEWKGERKKLEDRWKGEMEGTKELEREYRKEKAGLQARLKEQDSMLETLEKEFRKLKESPKIMEVEKVVEVESEELKAALDQSNDQCEELRDHLDKLKQLCEEGLEDLQAKEEENDMLKQQLSEQENQLGVLKTEVEAEIVTMKRDKEESLRQLQAELRRESNVLQLRYDALKTCFTKLRPGLLTIGEEYKQLRALCKQFPTYLNRAIEETKEEIQQALHKLEGRNHELEQRYHKELARRKKYHNELIDLKGNIRVLCRVRPVIKEDGCGLMAKSVVTYDEDDDGLISLLNKTRNTTYEVDRVFSDTSTQEEVFAEVEPLIVSSVDGYNVCIFAYGQTGSGKTFTMEGQRSNPGINQRALMTLFSEVEHRSSEWQYSIKVSVMEIYNENLRDLLSDSPSDKLDVRISPEGGLHVPGLTEILVESVGDINEVFQIGRKNRSTASTDMNERSSRSHAMLCVTVTGTNSRTKTKTTGRLNLVDLAGSERVGKSGSNSDADRMKEAQNINKSLSALGDVIQALRGKQNHIPYRNSKLTYLLQDSLGGDSKTLMVVQISPVAKNSGESQCTLSFAQRVRSVELGAAKKKVETPEVTALKERLLQYEEGGSSPYAASPRGKGTPTSRKGTPKLR